jgi:geranylgeranyl reductase
MKAHGRVFWILGIMQRFWYATDQRRERFVSICRDPDVQQLTWQAYMHKELVRAKPMAHVRIFFKDLAHLAGVVRPGKRGKPNIRVQAGPNSQSGGFHAGCLSSW